MAQSIKLGSDIFLDASGVDGIKGTISAGDDLNNYIGYRYAGLWYINASSASVSNCPVSYAALICVPVGSSGVTQIAVNHTGVYYRNRSGSPITWSVWRRCVGALGSGYLGQITGNEGASAVSMTNNAWKTALSVPITETGVYIVEAALRFNASTVGVRAASISTNSTPNEASVLNTVQLAAQSSGTTLARLSSTIALDAGSTLYLHGFQNSGAALSATPRLRLVRLS